MSSTEEWEPVNFPDPNPYFPPRPRARPGLPWIISLPLFLGGGPGTIYSFKYMGDIPTGVALVLMLGSFIAFLVGMVSFFQSFTHIPWRFGRIVPVYVHIDAKSPEQTDAISGLAGCLAPFPLNLLLALAKRWQSGEEAPNALLVKWVEDGRLRSAQPVTGSHWGKWSKGDIAWLCLLPPFHPMLVETICPNDFIAPEPNREVAQSVQDAVHQIERMDEAEQADLRRRVRETLREFHLAAKANKNAYTRALRYEKRSR